MDIHYSDIAPKTVLFFCHIREDLNQTTKLTALGQDIVAPGRSVNDQSMPELQLRKQAQATELSDTKYPGDRENPLAKERLSRSYCSRRAKLFTTPRRRAGERPGAVELGACIAGVSVLDP